MTTHGILVPSGSAGNWTLERLEPPADLAPFIDRFWSVEWSRGVRMPFTQATLPHPCVNVVLGTHRIGVHGPSMDRFVARLEGDGWVVGAKFHPGGFRPFLGEDVATLAGRELPIASVLGASIACDRTNAHERLVDFFRQRLPAAFDPNILVTRRAVDRVREDRTIARASDLAMAMDMSVRTLQRLFRSYVGVSPKWVIRRCRIHEACDRVAKGEMQSWSALAHELGYCDQAHFVRDFKAQVDVTPSRYAEMCRA